MKMRISFLFFAQFILLNLCGNGVQAQSNDSLWIYYQDKSNSDSLRFKAIDDLIWERYIFEQTDSALYYTEIELRYAKTIGKRYMAIALNTKGTCYYLKNDFENAIKYLLLSHDQYEALKDLAGMAVIHNNIGNIYKEQGDMVKAITFFTKSLRTDEKLHNRNGIATSLNNIGIVYAAQGNYKEAVKYYKRSAQIRKQIGDRKGMATPLNNIGNVYESESNYPKAIEYYTLSLEIEEEYKNSNGIATSLNNIAGIYLEMGDLLQSKNVNPIEVEANYSKALDFAQRAMDLASKTDDNTIITTAYVIMGSVFSNKGDYKKAIDYCKKAVVMAEGIGAVRYTKDAAHALYQTYKKVGDEKNALAMYELFIQMKDSISSEENRDEIIRQEYKYKYEKQAEADSLVQAKQSELTSVKFKQEKTQRIALFGGLILVVIFSLFIYKRYKVTIRQKEIISRKERITNRQKIQLEEKNKEITDSINYAKRIQAAILPPAKIVKEYLKESFILYKPRDIVAGDFYWMEQITEGLIFAAADCTGHGVPGAMVSMMCHNALNRSVREHGLVDPGEILDKTREMIISEFEKSDDEMKDGMDISLCVLTYQSIENNEIEPLIKLRWSGANNPLWILRNNSIIEYKGDKQPIGVYLDPKPFTTHDIELFKGDVIYIFTDGYQDQFGGAEHIKGKKIKTARMREMFLEIADKSMDEQRLIIDTTFEEWKGNHEQVDDVCVIGVRI